MSRRRGGREARGGGGGRTVLWVLLIVVMAVAVGVALAREATKDDAPDSGAVVESVPTRKLLIREGLRREDIAALLDTETGMSGARYLALTAPGSRGRRMAGTSKPTSLEGFLFPATYEITDDTTPAQLVGDQLDAYEANTSQVNYAYAKSKNLTEYDVLILASMIEREVAVARERPIVAGVMYNRLKAGMRLDIDATVQFALGEWKPELSASDLAIGSPYNTRRFTGLPPGPICNPGLDSIRAAARPAKVPYVYYVARNDGSGRHFFATTPEQFDRDVARSEANAGG
ncbi:MAG TPA: endolytic transglycosylase MltG [Miltoncostaeaceae bacterium]|nr:endolytic transglycosylase MltG [Miltoncostaeaceae bacterium]